MKQDRFVILTPNGTPDYSFDMVNGEQVKRIKVNRPKALCFDYLQLKDAFGLELETEVINDTMDMIEDTPDEGRSISNNSTQKEFPF